MIRKIFFVIGLTTFLSSGVVSLTAQTTAGLQLWLKPDGLTNTANLSKVSYWTNSVGGGNDATNGIVVNQPSYLAGALNGYPVVRFNDDGSSATSNTNLNWLASGLPLSANSNSFTAVIVFESQITGQRDTLIQQLGNGNTIFYIQTNGVPALNPNIDSFASAKELPSPFAYPVRNWTILSLVQDAVAGTVTISQNGLVLTNTSIGTVATLANAGWLFGCNKNKNTHGLNGDIAEVMIYNQALNTSDLGNTTYYLAQKYGFVALTDNFNTADTGNLEADLGTRQSGSAAPAGYYWESGQIVGNQVRLEVTPGASFAAEHFTPKVDFVTNESGNFHLSYDVTSITNATGNPYNSWVGVVIRSATALANPVGPDGFNSILFYNGGSIEWINAGQVSANGNRGITPPYHIDLIANNNVLTYLINSTNVVGAYSLPCGLANYVSLSVGTQPFDNATATIDNFAFTATPVASAILPTFAASLKLADSFSAADSADINATVAARQVGSAAPIMYSTNGNLNTVLSLTGNALLLTNSPGGGTAVGMASPSVDLRQFEHLNSFRMRFTVAGANDATANDSWVGVRFRDTRVSRFVASTDGGGTAINLFPGDGRWYLWQSFLGATNTSGTVASGTVTASNSYAFDIEVRTNIMRVKVNGQPLQLGCGTETYQLSPAQAANFVTLQCLATASATAAYAQFDDFKFESLDPGFTVPSPTILNSDYTSAGPNSAFRLSLNSSNSIFYAVDSKTSLAAPAWNYLGGVVGNGALASYTNSPATNNLEFYRLRVP